MFKIPQYDSSKYYPLIVTIGFLQCGLSGIRFDSRQYSKERFHKGLAHRQGEPRLEHRTADSR